MNKYVNEIYEYNICIKYMHKIYALLAVRLHMQYGLLKYLLIPRFEKQNCQTERLDPKSVGT